MALQSTDKFYQVQGSSIISGPGPRPPMGPSSPDSTLAASGWYRLWEDDGGAAPGPYYRRELGEVIVNEGATPARCERVDTWAEYTPLEKRQAIEGRIDQQRQTADRLNIDLQADPGLSALMDEANANASRKRAELGAADDSGLDAFDPTFDPLAADSIQVAASLSRQERAILASANQFSEQQRSDLAAAATQHEAIVDAGDPAAAIPEVPSFARRMVGVMGEEYGALYARRVFVNPWYWLEAEFRIERDLGAADYFLAIYDENAPDDRDDTTASYLTTAQFTVIEPGKLIATKEAINLPRAFDFGYKLVICKGHLSQPQFDRVLFAGNLWFEEWRVRWGGLA